MNISVINHTNGQITDADLQHAIRAINRQIKEDFEPNWSMYGTLRLEGRSTKKPDHVKVADMRGDAIIYLWDKTDIEDALGYHLQNNRGIPFGFVFTSIASELGESWTVTLSHEALELLADPQTNMLAMGPHPSEDRDVFHWFEMCDAVQSETYQIDGVDLSNFVLPLYFTGTRDTDEIGARNDFLGTITHKRTLTSFGINPGGYIGFYDPELQDHDTFAIEGDARAAKRLALKGKAKEARRSVRYRTFETSASGNGVPADRSAGAITDRSAGATTDRSANVVKAPSLVRAAKAAKAEDKAKPGVDKPLFASIKGKIKV